MRCSTAGSRSVPAMPLKRYRVRGPSPLVRRRSSASSSEWRHWPKKWPSRRRSRRSCWVRGAPRWPARTGCAGRPGPPAPLPSPPHAGPPPGRCRAGSTSGAGTGGPAISWAISTGTGSAQRRIVAPGGRHHALFEGRRVQAGLEAAPGLGDMVQRLACEVQSAHQRAPGRCWRPAPPVRPAPRASCTTNASRPASRNAAIDSGACCNIGGTWPRGTKRRHSLPNWAFSTPSALNTCSGWRGWWLSTRYSGGSCGSAEARTGRVGRGPALAWRQFVTAGGPRAGQPTRATSLGRSGRPR